MAPLRTSGNGKAGASSLGHSNNPHLVLQLIAARWPQDKASLTAQALTWSHLFTPTAGQHQPCPPEDLPASQEGRVYPSRFATPYSKATTMKEKGEHIGLAHLMSSARRSGMAA